MRKQEILIKLFLAVLYVSSLVSIGLWMAGYLNTERVTYTRFEVKAEKDIKELTEIEVEDKENFDNKTLEHTEKYPNETNINDIADHDTVTKEVPQDTSSLSEESNVVDDEEVNEEVIEQDEQVVEEVKEVEEEVVEVSNPEKEESRQLDIAYNLEDLEANMNWSSYTPVKVLATGYTAGFESTGKEPGHPQYGITFSGVQVRRDLYSTIAADTTIFPLGTILYIPNYGYGVVADIGSAITGNKIDLYYETVEDVYNLWGKQEIEVYVIQKGDGKVTEAMLDELNQNEVLQAFKQR